MRHLHHHIRTELHPVGAQLQATGLLERGLEAAAPRQAGLETQTNNINSIEG